MNLPDQKERGICGAVGQLLQVEEAYETAMKRHCGAMQNVVTKTEEDAKNAIQYLKQRALGACYLLAYYSSERQRAGRSSCHFGRTRQSLDHSRYTGTFAEEYRGIMTYLLGRILIVENLDEAVRLAEKISPSV